MTEEKPVSKAGLSADWFLQGALSRIGDTVDRLTGRRWTPSSSLATSELIERVKRLLDAEAREVPGKGVIVPHNIRLKVQWDKFATDEGEALTKLEHELLTAAADHINDQLYYTSGPLCVEVKPDYFIEGVKLFVSFDDISDEENEAQMNVTIPSIDRTMLPLPVQEDAPVIFVYIARFELKGSRRDRRLKFGPKTRVSVGRTPANDLAIDDSSVSKIHASIVADADGKLAVADTGSTNGTFVNGERIPYGKAIDLGVDDLVRFGTVEIKFEPVPYDPEASLPPTGTSLQIEAGSAPSEPPEKTLEIDPPDAEMEDSTAEENQ